jgi:hypothetical protein
MTKSQPFLVSSVRAPSHALSVGKSVTTEAQTPWPSAQVLVNRGYILKTTLGSRDSWSALVQTFRLAGFTVLQV